MMPASNSRNHLYFATNPQLHGSPWSLPSLPRVLLRGPRVDFGRPYLACVGASQTFGRNSRMPWPALLPVNTLNLGLADASPRTFLNSELLNAMNGAEAVVLQVMSARSETAGAWSPVLDASGLVGPFVKRAMEVVRSDHCWKGVIGTPRLAHRLRRQAQRSWLRDYRRLLERIHVPVILLWISARAPHYEPDTKSLHRFYGAYPHFVTEEMMESLRGWIPYSVDATWPFRGYYPPQWVHCKICHRLMQCDLLKGLRREDSGRDSSDPVGY